jgi:trehalose utilization protein
MEGAIALVIVHRAKGAAYGHCAEADGSYLKPCISEDAFFHVFVSYLMNGGIFQLVVCGRCATAAIAYFSGGKKSYPLVGHPAISQAYPGGLPT